MWTLRNALFFVFFCSAVISSVTSDCLQDIRTCTARSQHERKLYATIECTILKQHVDCMEPVLDKCSGALLGTTEESLRKGIIQLKKLCTVGDPLYEKKEKFKDCLKASQDELKACGLADLSTEHKQEGNVKRLKSICRKSQYAFNCIYDVANRSCGSEGRDFVKESMENGLDVLRKTCAVVEIDISEAVISSITCDQDFRACTATGFQERKFYETIECPIAIKYVDCMEPVLIKCGAFLDSTEESLPEAVNQLKKLCTVGDPLYQKKEQFKDCLIASEDQFKACGPTELSPELKPEGNGELLESVCRKSQNVFHCIYDVANRACGSEGRDFVKESTQNSLNVFRNVCEMVDVDISEANGLKAVSWSFVLLVALFIIM